MIRITLYLLILLSATRLSAQENMSRVIDRAINNAVRQYAPLADSMVRYRPGRLPHSLGKDGSLRDVPPSSWLSGFFPGSLWYLYEYTGNPEMGRYARKFTSYLEKQQHNRGTHDIGFMVYCSYGNQQRIEPSAVSAAVLLNAARSLSSRFKPEIGCIRSWDKEVRPGWYYPVIIDNMMNLELLLWAWRETGDSTFLHVARTHADTTLKNHFRTDHSSYHVVNYDPTSGNVLFRGTFQGWRDDSSWARGQGWGLYGYTTLYRYTGEKRYLDHASAIADYIVSHPHLPADGIPCWDLSFTPATDTPRDASAAAVIASALVELSRYVPEAKRKNYLLLVKRQLRSLAGPHYTASEGTNGRMLLLHSTTSFPAGIEVDAPLSYADYYFLEALIRYKRLIIENQQPSKLNDKL